VKATEVTAGLAESNGSLQNKDTSLWNFTQNSGLRKFRRQRHLVKATEVTAGLAESMA